MKVLHLCTFPDGGAGIAARRIVNAERSVGIDATLKTVSDFGIDPGLKRLELRYWPYRMGRKAEYLIGKLGHSANPICHSLGLRSLGLAGRINTSDADIVHLHWINEGMLSIPDVARINKPLVWTLHDTWPFCGAEHYPDVVRGDMRWRDGYSRENFPATSTGLDLDRWVWNRKMRYWRNLNCRFTAPSRWDADLFNRSAFGKNRKKCVCVPNCVPTDVFWRGDKAAARERLGLRTEKRVIAFGACSLTDPIKGGDLLVEALGELCRRGQKVELLVFGDGGEEFSRRCGIAMRNVGRLSDPSAVASVYQAADVFVCPSRAETFGQTAAEALACGTPVAGFDFGGLKDVVEHGKTGYLARPYDPAGLANGIAWCLENAPRISVDCSTSIATRFGKTLIGQEYRKIYDEIQHTRLHP